MAANEAEAEAITHQSGSNFAFAFLALPRERRRDITVFYAFCRVIDDIADDDNAPKEERALRLEAWKRALAGPLEDEPSLAPVVRDLIARHRLDPHLFELIIEGCASDLIPARFETIDDLLAYCYCVASAVGLVSIELFGCRDARAREYAVALGYALQITNIVRDVAKDLANGGRIYLPAADMARFGVTADDLAQREGGTGFPALMAFEAERVETFYAQAVATFATLPTADRRALAPAEMMRLIYYKLLGKIRRGGFRVFGKLYRVGKLGKLAIALRVLLRRP